jgi:hypothetical protein
MAAHARVVLYGNSVFLAGIRADLERDASLELIPIEAGDPDATDMVRACRPRALLFDLAAEQPRFEVMLRERSDLLLIGVDASSDELLVLSSQPAKAWSISDLVQLIHGPGP